MTEPPAIPNAQTVYDTLMAAIEPDLVTDQLPLLKKKYAGESDEEKVLRKERYKKAFQEYDKQFSVASDRLFEQIRQYKKEQIDAAENQAQKDNETILHDLESAINAL